MSVRTKINVNDIFISTIHTHTGPLLTPNSVMETTIEEINKYIEFLMSRIADTTNGEMISSDWPGWMRRTVEKTLDDTKCVFITGAQ